ncbi:MAG: thiamine-monophosphate kinase [Gemmataceae bacterium]|nr:thiamine-monophosphate kinase [Gemmataceae bacterium]
MGELDYIRWIRQQTPSCPRILIGPGDDCAVVGTTTGRPMLVTTDMLMEGVDFILAEVGPRRVGRKAMAANLSDIAAMGGKPIAAFVSVALSEAQGRPSLGFAEELYAGLREMADRFDTSIPGGDTNTWTGGLVINVTLLGDPGPQGTIRRQGARPGDWLVVTGPLGGSILGKHLDFTPRVKEALLLQQHAPIHAMIDISDGLAADTFHICEESGCGAVLFADGIPISEAALRMSDGKTPLDHALSDGEDFELAFAVDPGDGARLLKSQPIDGITLAHAGEFITERVLLLEEAGQRRCIEPRGYTHRFS